MAMALLLAALLAASAVGMGAAHAQSSVALVLDPLPQSVRAGSTVTFSGYFVDAGGRGIGGADVHIKDDVDFGRDTVLGTLTTGPGGRFSGTWEAEVRRSGAWDFYAVHEGSRDAPYSRSHTYQMRVSQDGGGSYASGSGSGAGSGSSGYYRSSISLDRVPGSVYAGDAVTFSGRLTSQGGAPLAGKLVKVMEDDPLLPDQTLGYGRTDRNGNFEVAWSVGAGAVEHDFDVYAVFDGDSSSSRARSHNQVMTVLKYGGSITLDPFQASARVGDVVTFTGRLSLDGRDTEGAVVYIKDEDTGNPDDLLAAAYVDASGRYTAGWRVVPSDPNPTLEIYAVYEGDDLFYRLNTCDEGGLLQFGGLCRDTRKLRVLEPAPAGPAPAGGQYMELLYALNFARSPHVAIVPSPDSYDQTRRYIATAQEGIRMWEYDLERRHGGDWGVTFEAVPPGAKFRERPDVIINLVTSDSDRNCGDSYHGIAWPTTVRPVQARVCTEAGGQAYPASVVGTTAAHEFIHTVGLGHTFNVHRDMMCSVEDNAATCTGLNNKEGRPSALNLDAVAFMYGNDGYRRPNNHVTMEERFYATGPAGGPAPSARDPPPSSMLDLLLQGRDPPARPPPAAAPACDRTDYAYDSPVERHVLEAGWSEWYVVCSNGPISYWFETSSEYHGFELSVLPPETDVDEYVSSGAGSYYTCEDPDTSWHTKGGTCNVAAGANVVVSNTGYDDITLSGRLWTP